MSVPQLRQLAELGAYDIKNWLPFTRSQFSFSLVSLTYQIVKASQKIDLLMEP